MDKRMRTFMPFTYKMMISYLLLVLVTDAMIGYFSYTMLIQSRTEMTETNIKTAMEQTENNLSYQLDEIQRMSDTLFGSLSFQRALQKKGDPFQTYLTMLDEIVPQIQAPLHLYGNHIRLLVYTTNGYLNEVDGDSMYEEIKDSDYYILPYSEITNKSWFNEIKDSDRDNIWLQVDTDQSLNNISHFRKLVSYNDYKTIIGYVRITTRLDDLLGDFKAFPTEEGLILRLVDTSANSVLYQRGDNEHAEAASSAEEDQSTFLVLQNKIPNTSFVIETLVPRSYLSKDAGKLGGVIFSVCLISFLVMSLIGFLVARLSGRKMRRIISFLRSFQQGSFQKRLRFSGNDEFVHIAGAFNDMAGNIQDLIKKVYVEGIQKKQAELEALQAQINPHFLYNTLSTIGSLANLSETEKVTGMVEGLAKFYRLTLNDGQVFIPLAKELEQVEAYLDIQRIKYAGKFDVHIDMERELEDCKVIKLILQPFVENIFKHAWFGSHIAIRISGRAIGNKVELKVIDTGIGMKPDNLKSVMAQPGHAGGYGIRNVDDRIKLRYGDEYGIEMGSVFGGGTTVRILLPMDREGNMQEEEQRRQLA
ncbi:sensor histidine kinase [Paenibacillus glycanilyticus]|uniref:sensor histidine kinase n=1 Tax=Paenibacillus glycanilyticus TaxID=126569 RepID=UPI002040909A|nr:histidine kinase [Paenibacillus glycanilyticus]MCM3629190.1 sensor histidine kinase [Paenibacillus glycanilyticus]